MPGPEKAGCFDIADIVRAHRPALESSCTLSTKQRRVLDDIARCRTAALGGHVDRCVDCGYERPSYNSCRNRHCPKCQALAQEKWIAAQARRTLDVPHFHVVFTLPQELRPLARFAPRVVYNALFREVSRTLLEFGKKRGGTVGATLVLHTWNRKLEHHPHIHALVTGGRWAGKEKRWIPGSRAFLFPVHAMGRVFRAKMLDKLRAEYRKGAFAAFADFEDPEAFDTLVRKIAKLRWNVYSKPSYSNGSHVIGYLGRYTHRVGISNSRLLAVNENAITFRTKGNATATLSPVEFLRRFVLHILPDGFHKIRHIGINGSSKLTAEVRNHLQLPVLRRRDTPWQRHLLELTGRDVTRCPQCGGRLLSHVVPRARDPTRALAA